MFSNIANYLRGVNNNPAQEEILSVNAEVGPALATGSSICEYNAIDAEDDWVLVNKSEDHPRDGSLEYLTVRVPPPVVPKHSYETLQSLPPHGCHDGNDRVPGLHRTPSSSSLPSTLSFEESWFLTPPPCFTSTGPIHMETSSLENLLIEHPSMSVYQQRPSRPFLDGGLVIPGSQASPIEIVRCESVAEFDNEGSEELVLSGSLVLVVQPSSIQPLPERVEELATANRVTALSQRGATTTGVSSHVESQSHCLLHLRSAQKVQQKRACQVLKRSQMDRSNKARELNSRNRRQRRSDRMLRHSGANNNRKC